MQCWGQAAPNMLQSCCTRLLAEDATWPELNNVLSHQLGRALLPGLGLLGFPTVLLGSGGDASGATLRQEKKGRGENGVRRGHQMLHLGLNSLLLKLCCTL